MIKLKLYSILFILALTYSSRITYADYYQEANDSSLPTYTLPTLTVRGQEIANLRPASTFQSVVSNLDFDPRIDFQSRNIAEAQGDINIRGGIFEGTGIQIGAATLVDPQTGHYTTELPIAPEMLIGPNILTGTSNALRGFNSTAGTLSYEWSFIKPGSKSTLGFGDNGLNFQRILNATKNNINNSSEWAYGTELEYSHSESDGTMQNGDHKFSRVNARFQLLGPNSQTDFFAGYQDKYFGWPGMYTGEKYLNPVEYEDIQTELFIINHRNESQNNHHFEITFTHRNNFDRYTLEGQVKDGSSAGSDLTYFAEHKTKVSSLGLTGFYKNDENFGINYSSQITKDNMASSRDDYKEFDPISGLETAHYPTDGLTRGKFTTRSYYKFSVVPEYKISLNQIETFTIRAGGTFDETNRDSSRISPIADITWEQNKTKSQSKKAYLSYSETTQVLGYSAIGGSETGGIFKSKHDLKRGISKNLEFGFALGMPDVKFEGALFYIWDKDLADWTYSEGSSYARFANNLDMETFGFELIGTRRLGNIEGIASYTFLEKDAHYNDANVDASFYALNYAKHRVTLGVIWSINNFLKLRVDNEWRKQRENKLRNSDNNAVFTHLSLSVFPPKYPGLEFFAAIDNLWNEDFEDVPGTPGKGRQGSLGATFKW